MSHLTYTRVFWHLGMSLSIYIRVFWHNCHTSQHSSCQLRVSRSLLHFTVDIYTTLFYVSFDIYTSLLTYLSYLIAPVDLVLRVFLCEFTSFLTYLLSLSLSLFLSLSPSFSLSFLSLSPSLSRFSLSFSLSLFPPRSPLSPQSAHRSKCTQRHPLSKIFW